MHQRRPIIADKVQTLCAHHQSLEHMCIWSRLQRHSRDTADKVDTNSSLWSTCASGHTGMAEQVLMNSSLWSTCASVQGEAATYS